MFGSGPDLDSYLLAFMIPSFLADVFCGAIVPAAVPEFVELALRPDIARTAPFYSNVLRACLRLSFFVSALCGFGAAIALLAVPRAHHVRLVSALLFAMLPILPCAAAANVWRAVLNARSQFAIPAFTAVLAPLFIIAAVFAAGNSGGVHILAFGTTLASIAEVAILGWSVHLAGFPVWPPEAPPFPSLAAVRGEYFYLVTTAALGGGSVFLGQFMAASLGSGSVSILNYGTRLAGVLLALGPAALNVAILPRFSQSAAEGDWTVLRRSLTQVLTNSLRVSVPVAILLFFFSPLIVRLTLQHGAFTAADTEAVAAVQAISMLQLPFLVGIAILLRALSAMKANRVVVPVFSAALVLTTALTCLLMQHYRVSGIAWASCVGQASLFLMLIIVVFREGPGRFPTESRT
ncbi:MAG TPA: lipid II flippase MurJ [Bryobacteraceae bacterium]|nr:lipid II flippase MurJ [Bryobacteraceae bacterium]